MTLTATDAPAGRDVAHAGFVVRGPRSAGRHGESACAARAGDQHVERLQHVGRAQPVHGWHAGVVRPTVRARDAVPARGRTRRPQGPAGALGRGTRRRRPDLPAVPDRARLSVGDRLGRLVHLRTPLRRVGGGCGLRVRLRRVVRPRASTGTRDLLDGYDLVLSVGHDEYWSAGQRNAVEAHVQRGGNFASFSGNTMFWQVRLETTPTWSATSTPPTRPTRWSRAGQHGGDDRHVGRPARGAAGVDVPRRRIGVRVVPPVRSGHRPRRRRVRRVPRRPLAASRAPACATATCSARSTAWSATRRSAAR